MRIAVKVLVTMIVGGAAAAQAQTAGIGQAALYVPWPIPAIVAPPPLPVVIRPSAVPHAAPVQQAMPPAQPNPAEGIVSHAFETPAAPLVPGSVEAAAEELRSALRREVPGVMTPDAARQQNLIRLAQAEWRDSRDPLDHAQLVVVVDRNPRVQLIAIALARPDAPWEILGATHVSTGEAGRFDHYITPTGVFLNTADILGYRAQGTYNENHIRGYGVKGMRVWDFGWQTARKGWHGNGDTGEIRLEMHATDPEVLAQRIGRPASQGCVRIPEALNRFMDRHGVIDADYERAAIDDVRYRALLLPNRVTTPLAGNALVIVDSGGQV